MRWCEVCGERLEGKETEIGVCRHCLKLDRRDFNMLCVEELLYLKEEIIEWVYGVFLGEFFEGGE